LKFYDNKSQIFYKTKDILLVKLFFLFYIYKKKCSKDNNLVIGIELTSMEKILKELIILNIKDI
jgi:hypothetical protein